MFERRSSVIAFLVVATLLTLQAAIADLRRTQPTALIGAIWVFGTKKGTW
jgi:hypothetical protein